MLPIPPEFSHSLDRALGYIAFSSLSINKGLYGELGKQLGKVGAKKIEEIGKVIRNKLQGQQAENMLQESPEKLENTVTQLLQDPELKAKVKSLLWDSVVVGISGGSCSGKTWLANQFKKHCSETVCLFGLDGYYKESNYVKNLQYTHDNPKSIDISSAVFDLGQLKAGQEVEIPTYDFQNEIQDGYRSCKPSPIIIVEGIFAFYDPLLLDMFDLRIWVEADDIRRYDRRLTRDVDDRNIQDLEKIKDGYRQNVQPGYQKFIEPYRKEADFIIQNNNQCATTPRGLDVLLRGIEQLSYQKSK